MRRLSVDISIIHSSIVLLLHTSNIYCYRIVQSSDKGAAPRALILGVCAALLAITAVANAEGKAASVVVGLAKCADCTRKNMKAEEAFKGLQVAIKCKNSNGEYESKAVGDLDGSGQEPSKIVPLSTKGTFGVLAGAKTHYPSSAECASATMCGPIKKHFFDHFHKKPVPPKPEPKPQPHPDYRPVPPTPTYGGQPSSPTPIYHPPARH